jgi:hypothetical protein
MDGNVKPIYANNLSVALNSVEAILLFAVETPTFDKEGNANGGSREIVADIRMNPIFAKQLITALKESLNIYEEKYGEIKLLESDQGLKK